MRTPRIAFLALLGAVLVACSRPRLESEPAHSKERRAPNLILMMTDQHRGDALGCAGSPVRTPNLDRLASEGAFFRRAYSSTPSCTPARAALLTGCSPWGHGMLGYSRVAERYPNELPRMLSNAGYTTHAIGKNHFHPQRHRHGYDVVELDESGRVESEDFISDYRIWFREMAPDLDPDATGIGWNDYRSGPYQLPEELHPTVWTADRAVAFLEDHEDDDKPFLLKISFARPHSPYDPPARWLDRYRDVDVPAARVGAWSEEANGSFHKPGAYTAARNNLGPEVTASSRRAYYANVSFLDENIGRILRALEATGQMQNTVLVFLSDHGDMLGDHHLWRKTYAYEGSARIPMILWWGSEVLEGAPRGRRRDELVEIRDVLPTLLDAADVPVPDTVEGRSLFDLVRDVGSPWREVLDLEHATCYWPENTWNALTDARYKYIWFAKDGTEQLFDLEADPDEARDLAREPSYRATLESWRRRLGEHLHVRGPMWTTRDRLPARRENKILLGVNYPRPDGENGR